MTIKSDGLKKYSLNDFKVLGNVFDRLYYKATDSIDFHIEIFIGLFLM